MISSWQGPRNRCWPFLRSLVVLAAVALGTLTACGGDGSSSGSGTSEGNVEENGETTGSGPAKGSLAGSAASYDVFAGKPQRVLMGFSTSDGDSIELLSGGKVTMAFRFAGTQAKPIDPPEAASVTAEAAFLPVPGDPTPPPGGKPKLGPPSAGRGLYGSSGVMFDRAGIWMIDATAETDKGKLQASAALLVNDKAQVPAPGDPAPATDNAVLTDVAAKTINPQAVESRADPEGDGSDIPNPALHTVRIRDALAAKRPVVVVVSTPSFCQSQFCGPITDVAARFQQTYGDRADFVHLEVWKDFEKAQINKAAAEWILPKDGGQGREPWVFLVGRDGRIAERFDNLVSDAEFEAAIKRLVA